MHVTPTAGALWQLTHDLYAHEPLEQNRGVGSGDLQAAGTVIRNLAYVLHFTRSAPATKHYRIADDL